MRVSDLYGPSFGQSRTQDDTQPTVSQVAADAANDNAKGKGSAGSGTIVIMILIGILVGAKFALEK